MHQRNQRPIRRVDVRQLEKLALLDLKKPNNNEAAAGKTGAPRIARPNRWM